MCGKCGKAYDAPPASAARPAGARATPAPGSKTPARWIVPRALPRLATPPSARLRLLAAWLAVEFVGAAVLYAVGDTATTALVWLVAGCCACQAAIILGA